MAPATRFEEKFPTMSSSVWMRIVFSHRTRLRASAICSSMGFARWERSRKYEVQIRARSAQIPGWDSWTAACSRRTRGETTARSAGSASDDGMDPLFLEERRERLELVWLEARKFERREWRAEPGLLGLPQVVVREQLEGEVAMFPQ